LLVHTICYKSKDGWLGDSNQERKALKHHEKFIANLFEELSGATIVPLGEKAIKAVKSVLFFKEYFPGQVITACGATYYGWTKPDFTGIQFPVIPMKHLSRPPTPQVKSKVAELIITEYRRDSSR
jgi:hypothetical protein